MAKTTPLGRRKELVSASGGDEKALRRQLIDTCLKMTALGINQGTSGNVSSRWRDGLLITPSGMNYEDMQPDDIVFLGLDGTVRGRCEPSSEWRFHRDILVARPEVGAVIHTHSVHATAIAICRKTLPAAHYMIGFVGGPTVRCAPYATYGSQELSDHAVKALRGRNACLLANHGVIAVGPTIDKALFVAHEVEVLARQYILALQVGRPRLLPATEIARVMEKFKNYGPNRESRGAGS